MNPSAIRDLHVYGGALLMGLGVGAIHLPAGIASVGVFLCAVGLFYGRPSRRR